MYLNYITLSHKIHNPLKGILSCKLVYRISVLGSLDIFLILKRNGRNTFINIHSCKQIFKLFLKQLNEFVFSVMIHEKFHNMIFNEILGL
jgi:hypothetical protein